MMLTFGSLFSGIGGFDLGFERAGMKCAWQCEIDQPYQNVLQNHWPEVKRYDDVREISSGNTQPVDLICGGFPCQDVSIAGRRAGLDGKRSGLWFEFARIIDELDPRWVVIENVPGLLSSNNGRDFETIIRFLAERGYGVVWRVLDAQYFGVAQRRRRVFVVASLGDGCSAEVLYEREGLRWDPPARRKAGQEVAHALTASPSISGRQDPSGEDYIVGALNSGKHPGGFNGQDAYSNNHLQISYKIRGGKSGGGKGYLGSEEIAFTLHGVEDQRIGIRRLTPTECSRLQGFPDNWNAWLSDSARYKQFGNAVCVPVAEWIGKRIVGLEAENDYQR